MWIRTINWGFSSVVERVINVREVTRSIPVVSIYFNNIFIKSFVSGNNQYNRYYHSLRTVRKENGFIHTHD